MATSEEYIPGEGTYESRGKIYSAAVGHLEFGEDEKTTKVIIINEPALPKTGDIIIGLIKDTGSNMVTVEILQIEGKERGIATNTYATIHISRISQSYTDNPRREFRRSELIRAKVIQMKPSIQLSTNEQDLGIVKAYCLKCRHPLDKKDSTLYCEKCDRTEHRKFSERFYRC